LAIVAATGYPSERDPHRDESMSRFSREAVARLLAHTTIALLIVTALALVVAGPGHKSGLVGLGIAFSALAVSALCAVMLTISGLAAAWMTLRRGLRALGIASVVGALAGFAVTANNLFWFVRLSNAPAIHDITTDVRNPPVFVALAEERAAAPNRADYPGIETAEAQLTWYPDIGTLSFRAPFEEVFAAAEASAVAMEWEVVHTEQRDGRIEATERTAFFGFRDDVVIRVRQREGLTLVDVRSKSRVGVGDLGTNARRVRAYIEELQSRLR
jgi:hypothetical protein